MGLIDLISGGLFGGGRNVIKETAEVFKVNAEAQAGRNAAYSQAALQQFAAEFAHPRKGWFDRLVDGLNRLPRPLMAYGVLGLFWSAMVDPVWFTSRMVGLQAVPEPLWIVLGAIVSFYFGARELSKYRDHSASVARSVAAIPQVVENLETLNALKAETTEPTAEVQAANDNQALTEWRQSRGGAQ